MNSKLLQLWIKLIGSNDEFSLEERIFNFISAFATLCILFSVGVNFYLGIAEATNVMLAALAIILVNYYLARVKRKMGVSLFIFGFFNYVIMVAIYIYNGGVSGPATVVFLVSLLFLIAVSPKRFFWLWLILHAALGISLLIYEYHNPDAIPEIYSHRSDYFLDVGITYLVVMLAMFTVIRFLKQNYAQEKSLAGKRFNEIQKQNGHILTQKEELENANMEKNRLLSILAHDLRSPLASVESYLELLNAGTDLDKEQDDTIKKELYSRTRDVSSMLINVLTWAKSQMEGTHPQLKQQNLEQALFESTLVQFNIARDKGLTPHLDIPDGLQACFDGDMLQIVIRNLVNNAIKFTPTGGEITLRAREADHEVIISIEDNGTGIPKHMHEDLFEFKNRSNPGTESEKGSGLGLVLCKEYVETQNGRIWFESEADKGSRFYISLPARCS